MRSIQNRFRAGLLAVLAAGSAGGCVNYTAAVKPPGGLLFQHVSAPLTTNVNGNPTGPAVRHVSQRQTAYFHDIVFTGLSFAWDDATIRSIAREGGIEHVSYADYELMSILGIYATFTVRVHGY